MSTDRFEDQFFGSLLPKKSRTATKTRASQADLDLSCFQGSGQHVHIAQDDKGVSISGIRNVTASMVVARIKRANPDSRIIFSEDYLDFEAEEDLLKKSENPLWIIKPVAPGAVRIDRAW